MILEMFHVKHFCPVAAQNLTSAKTAPCRDYCNIARSFCAIQIWLLQRLHDRQTRRFKQSPLYDSLVRTVGSGPNNGLKAYTKTTVTIQPGDIFYTRAAN
jgi:hypothetical protein